MTAEQRHQPKARRPLGNTESKTRARRSPDTPNYASRKIRRILQRLLNLHQIFEKLIEGVWIDRMLDPKISQGIVHETGFRGSANRQ